jgi:glutamine amidotransferase
MLERLRRLFPAGAPELPALHDALGRIAAELRAFGDFNFLLSNGEALFAHCSTRLAYVVRRAPFQTAHLVDEDYSVDFARLTRPDDRVAVIATVPLTDNESWTPIAPGQLIAFRDGEPVTATG